VAAALLAALVAVIGFVALRPDDSDGAGTQADDTASSSPSPSPSTSSSTSSASTSSAPTSSTPTSSDPTDVAAPTESGAGTSTAVPPTPQPAPAPAPVADPLSAANIQAFLADYHRQVVQDPGSAYDRTGPTLRAAISRANYVAYWSQFSDVTLSEVQAVDGQTRVTGRLSWTYTDGRVVSAVRRFTLIEQGGQLVLDSERDP